MPWGVISTFNQIVFYVLKVVSMELTARKAKPFLTKLPRMCNLNPRLIQCGITSEAHRIFTFAVAALTWPSEINFVEIVNYYPWNNLVKFQKRCTILLWVFARWSSETYIVTWLRLPNSWHLQKKSLFHDPQKTNFSDRWQPANVDWIMVSEVANCYWSLRELTNFKRPHWNPDMTGTFPRRTSIWQTTVSVIWCCTQLHDFSLQSYVCDHSQFILKFKLRAVNKNNDGRARKQRISLSVFRNSSVTPRILFHGHSLILKLRN